jgi:hypothetical protein
MRYCPICGSVFDNTDGAIMHMLNKKDDEHAHIGSKYQAAIAIQENEGGVDTPEVGQNTQTLDDDTKEEPLKDGESGEAKSSDLFDEPDGGGLTGEALELPCGHESVNPEEIPDGKNVTCSVCGRTHGVRK